jgi:AcrR family transcriptional regulator
LVLDVVIEILETGGYDAVLIRDVARRAQVSLATLYADFSSRDELIVAAVERWMEEHTYSRFTGPVPSFTSQYDGLMYMLRNVFEPWEQSPWMLNAFHRARSGAGHERLEKQGVTAVSAIASELSRKVDMSYAQDVASILEHVQYSLIARYVRGDIAFGDIFPVLERTVYRLTEVDSRDHRPTATRAARRKSTRP